jgi:hypothetical protein
MTFSESQLQERKGCTCCNDLADASDDIDLLRGMLQQAIDTVRQGRLTSIGSLDNTYRAHVPRSFVERWDGVLKETLR